MAIQRRPAPSRNGGNQQTRLGIGSSSKSLGNSPDRSARHGGGSKGDGTKRMKHQQQQRKPVTPEIERRCAGTLGTWCVEYHTQAEVPARAPPRGNKTCSLNCNQVGVCNALSGLCTCPAGWTGFNCLHPMKRYCTHKYRDWGFEPPKLAPNFTESNGPHAPNRFQNTVSRCAGDCDDDVAVCWCPANTTFGRIPAPADAPPGKWSSVTAPLLQLKCPCLLCGLPPCQSAFCPNLLPPCAAGTPPTRRGRPLPQYCQPNTTADGTQTGWGFVPYQDVFGPKGWCMAEWPRIKCDCFRDGLGGERCDQPYEQYCLNQCNGRGECLHGFCKCDPGWHGIDCAHQSVSADATQPGREEQRPWIAEHVHTPAAREFASGATRKRPLIFVYELPSDFSTLMLQYRQAGGGSCTARTYTDANSTLLSTSLYNLESGFLEMLLQSEHRTLDPEEADYFYVPVLTSCWVEHVRSTADSVRDMMYGVHGPRVHGITRMLLEAFHWVQSHFPYWDRRGGRDHIWLVTFDEASCYVPAAIRASIILSQWGRKDLNHTTGTGYWEDEYSNEFQHPQVDALGPAGCHARCTLMHAWTHRPAAPRWLRVRRGKLLVPVPAWPPGPPTKALSPSSLLPAAVQWEPDGFLRKIAGHACYDPVKDLVLPSMKTPEHFRASPLIGAPTRDRTWLAFHRGRVQPDNPPFSRGIRQRLAKAAKENNWLDKYRIAVGDFEAIPGDYSELLASSIFCLYLPGDGWSARMEDATLHGCIPAIIVDEVDVSFESILDCPAFTVRIPQADAEKLPEILQAIPEKRRLEMRHNLARVWQRFTWSSYRPYARAFREIQAQHREAAQAEGPATALSLPATQQDLDPLANDAFGTVMAWLHARIPHTRGLEGGL
ncbi:hypothetical protein ABPG77_007865 [Micractinium sp. CCAP 211/92]